MAGYDVPVRRKRFPSGANSHNPKVPTMKTGILSTATLLALAAAALPLRAGTYTANVAEGETQTIDAAFVSSLGSDDLVKTGRGKLVSSADMASYTGTITIREGAFEVKTTSDLGTADGGTIVENGGTLVVSMASSSQRFSNEPFTIEGTGDAAYGAAVYQRTANDQFKIFKYLTLSGDATICSSSRLGVDGGTLTMNGHTLTLKGVNYQFRDVTYAAPLGNLVVESNLSFVRNQTATADATKTLTLQNGGRISFAEAYTAHSFWRLVVEEGGKIASFPSATAQWNGNVTWNSTAADNITGLLTFTGDVAGTGTIKSSSATLTFAKPLGADVCLDLSGTATAVLKGFSYSHKGMKTIHRNSWTYDLQYFSDARNDVTRDYCAYGPGPQLDSWPTAAGNQSWCSRGYLWNREATNVTYTIFVGCVYQTYVFIDGTQVYNNKRDSWNNSYTFEMEAGTCVPIDIITVGGADGGPRSDNDKVKINGVIANDPSGYYFTTNAVSVLENTPALTTLSLADDGVIDASNLPMSVADLGGGAVVTNVTTLTVSGSWMLDAADIMAGQALVVYGDLAFGNGCTFAVTDLWSLPITETFTVCTADSITGLASGDDGLQRRPRLDARPFRRRQVDHDGERAAGHRGVPTVGTSGKERGGLAERGGSRIRFAPEGGRRPGR